MHWQTAITIAASFFVAAGILGGWGYGVARFFRHQGEKDADERASYQTLLNKLTDLLAQKDKDHQLIHDRIDKFEAAMVHRFERNEEEMNAHQAWHLNHKGRKR